MTFLQSIFATYIFMISVKFTMPQRIGSGKEKWVELMHMNIRSTLFVPLDTMRGAFF